MELYNICGNKFGFILILLVNIILKNLSSFYILGKFHLRYNFSVGNVLRVVNSNFRMKFSLAIFHLCGLKYN